MKWFSLLLILSCQNNYKKVEVVEPDLEGQCGEIQRLLREDISNCPSCILLYSESVKKEVIEKCGDIYD